MKEKWFQTAFDELLEGLVIMNEYREICYLNQQARLMTGWNIGDRVPYCSYCQMRKIGEEEERCLLASQNSLPAFEAFMPTYKGIDESFEMSLSSVSFDGEKHWVLVLRNPQWASEKQQLKIKQLLVHDSLSVQEAERKRISYELHDHIGQNVFSIFLGLQSIKPTIVNEGHKDHLLKMEKSLQDTLDNIKSLSKELHPTMLYHLGFERTLRDYTRNRSEIFGVPICLRIDMNGCVLQEEEKELHLFRIIQEAVHNAVRHGKAKHISILIEWNPDEEKLLFKITDDGIGFDQDEVKNKGLGLYHMVERLNIIGGEIHWRSEINKYTIVEGIIPLKGENLS